MMKKLQIYLRSGSRNDTTKFKAEKNTFITKKTFKTEYQKKKEKIRFRH